MFYACMEQVSNPSYKYLSRSGQYGSRPLVDPDAFRVDFTKYMPNWKKPVAPEGSTRLKLLYTNDWHGQTDNMGGILGASLQFDSSTKGQKLDTLKLIAGDSWSGANGKKNSLILNLMNYMGFDACTIGNHELDSGSKAFIDTIKGSYNTKFVSSNLKTTQGKTPEGVVSSFVKEENGNKYGIIGLSPIDLKTVVVSEKIPDLDVLNYDETVRNTQAEIDKLRAQGVNKIIILSHIGKDLDEKLAQSLDGVDIIVGGHSHDKIQGAHEGENLVYSKSGEPVIILQTGQNAENYGILDAQFSPEGILTRVKNSVIETNRQKNSVIEAIKDSEIGISPQVGFIDEVPQMPENRRLEPSPWTACIADSMREALNTDVAIINSANIRKIPQIGKLTERDIEESAPMKNDLLKTQMSEEQIVSGIKNAAYRSFGASDGYPGLLQCSGVRYTIDSNGKLLLLSFVDRLGNETVVDVNNPSKTKMYTVALDSFLANGKEYPEMVPKAEVEKFNFDKDTTMIEYVKKRPDKDKLVFKDDGRLRIVKTLEPRRQNSNTRNI